MKAYLITALLSLLLAAQTASGHADHAPVTASVETAQRIASQVAGQFASHDPGLGFGKLADSWRTLDDSSTSMHKQGNGYYIVAVHNAAEQKTLYVLMALSGDVYDANFSGQFPGLDNGKQ